MSTSEICPVTPGYSRLPEVESKKADGAKNALSGVSGLSSEYLSKNSRGAGKILGRLGGLVDTIPDLVDLGKASAKDFSGHDKDGRETMKLIAGTTAKGITASAIAAGAVATMGVACTVLVAPAAAVAVPVVAIGAAAAMYFAPEYADGLARKAVDAIGDGAMAAAKWAKSLF